MTRTGDQPDVPASERPPGDEAELDALAEAEIDAIPVERDGPPAPAGGRFRSAVESVLPRREFADQRDIIGGAGQNVIGLAAGVLATFATQVIMTRSLGAALFGVVTLTTQFAFIASTATRFGMDVANVRLVAILMGRGEAGRVRPLVRTSAIIATVVSVAVGIVVVLPRRLALDRLRLPAPPSTGQGRVLGRSVGDPVRRGDVGVPGRDAWPEDHAAHAVHLLDRTARRLGPALDRRMVRGEDRRRDLVRVRHLVGDRVRGGVVGLGAGEPRVRGTDGGWAGSRRNGPERC